MRHGRVRLRKLWPLQTVHEAFDLASILVSGREDTVGNGDGGCVLGVDHGRMCSGSHGPESALASRYGNNLK